MTIILIDTREQNAPYISKRLSEQDIENEISTLPQNTGSDYLIANTYGSCAIQRKVVCSEMIGQLDEIMFEIIPRLKNFSENPVLVCEENFGISQDGYLFNRADNRPTEFLAKSYYGYLETIRKMGIDVVTTRGLNETIWYLVSMHGYLGKEHYPKHNKYFSDKEIAIGMLTAIPGIGDVRASKALQEGSIRSMMGMKQIRGLTSKQAERLNKVCKWVG